MKKICTLLLLCVSAITLCNAQSGIIHLKITDRQNLNLPGATVYLPDLGAGGYTDSHGEVTFTHLSPGKYKAEISYIGYHRMDTSVVINDREPVNCAIQLIPGVQLTQGVLIMGDRLEGQAKALNTQKSAPNITNIISADQVGRFPDANIGDALKRVPGITMQNDQGEARNMLIRGLAPQLNSVTLNGSRIPSAEGDNRNVQMDLIPSDMIQTVIVNKTLLPDMDADAIGGSVNLVTRPAPNGLRLSGTASAGISPIRNTPLYTGSFVAGTRIINNKFGLLINGSYNNTRYGSDNVESKWSEDKGSIYTGSVNMRRYEEWRIRSSIGIASDFKINENNTIYVNGMYNWRDDRENRFQYEITKIKPVTDNDGKIASYTGNLVKEVKGGIGNDRNKNRRLEDQRMRTISLKGTHFLDNRILVSWSTSYSKASEEKPHERYIGYEKDQEPIALELSDIRFPLAVPDQQPDLSDYTLNELTDQHEFTSETEFAARADIKIPIKWINKLPGSVKFGGRLRLKKKERANNFFSYAPTAANGGMGDMSAIPVTNKTSDRFYPGAKYETGFFPTAKFMGGLDLSNPALFDRTDEPSEYLADNYHAREDIGAGYIMLSQQISNKLLVIAGARLENTAIAYTGNVIENEETLQGKAQKKNSYTNILPDILFKYNIKENFILRAAWTNSLARPNYYDLVPYTGISTDDEQVSIGNPGLKATTASNFDLMAENYFKSVGLISGGVFYKKLRNFIYPYRDNNFTTDKFSAILPAVTNPIAPGEAWAFTQPRNGESVAIYGLEVSLQRQLDFLPGFWRGLGVYLNYTYTHSKANGIYNEDGDKREGLMLPGTAPHLFNASLSYENKWISIRLSGNYAGAYLNEVGGDSFEDIYYDQQFFLDANVSIKINPHFRIFAEANNLTNQPLRYYQGIADRTYQVEYYGPRFDAGVKFDLSR